VLAALMCTSAGCHNLKNQLKALAGSDTASAATSTDASGRPGQIPTGPHMGVPHAYGSRPPGGILDQTFHTRHDPVERDPGAGLRVPRIDWSGRGVRSGGGFGEGSRHD